MKKNILYISTSLFPKGQAYSTRLVNFARLFNFLEIDVHIISDFTYEVFTDSKAENCFEGCTYQIVSGKPTSFNRIRSTFNSTKIIKEYLDHNSVDFVIIGNCYDRFNRVKRICKERKIPLILEICEWYDTKLRKFGNLNPYNFIYNRCMKYDYIKSDGVIAISQYLYNYFKRYTDNVIRIPTILDTYNTEYSLETKNNKIVIVHVGFSGRHKEKFKNILIALQLLEKKQNKFEYNIYGSDKADVLKNLGSDEQLLESLSGCVNVKGRVPQDKVNSIFMNADFSIFIRPQKRSSNAGFPTKLAESMIAGTPVISNNTGDIGSYLINGENGYLLKDDSPEAIKDVFIRILEMKEQDFRVMRKNARRTAEMNFDFRIYSNEVRKLLSEVK